jgi:hypothetical protein
VKIKSWLCVAVLAISSGLQAQFSGDVLGAHNLSPGGQSPIKGGALPPCQYCHAPHSGTAKGPLWAQTFSKQTYALYGSRRLQQPLPELPRWNRSSWTDSAVWADPNARPDEP